MLVYCERKTLLVGWFRLAANRLFVSIATVADDDGLRFRISCAKRDVARLTRRLNAWHGQVRQRHKQHVYMWVPAKTYQLINNIFLS